MATCPDNHNLAQGSKFLLAFSRLPLLSFFCTAVNLPGVSLGSAVQNTPFSDLPVPGDKLQYEDFNVTFLIDEPFKCFDSVYKWMQGLGFPENYDQYKNLGMQDRLKLGKTGAPVQYSDAVLYVYTNKNNPSFMIKFKDCFPTSLSGVQFSTQNSADNILTADVSFKYAYYTIERS